MSNETTPFNPVNWALNIQVAFESWATVECVKIITYLISRKGKPVYSIRGLGIILGSSKSSIGRAITLLLKHKYITQIGNCYFINSSLEIVEECLENETSVPESGQVSQKTDSKQSKVSQVRDRSVPDMGHNNNKEIIINNNNNINIPLTPKKKSPHNAIIYPDWVDAECSELLDEWLLARKEMKKRVSQSILNHNLKPFKNSQELKPALEATVGNGWIGIPRDYNQNRNLTPNRSPSNGYRYSQNFINGLHNEAVVRMYEQMEEQEKIEQGNILEIEHDKQNTNGKDIKGILSTIPQLNTKTRYNR